MKPINQNVFQFNHSNNVRTFADEKGEYWFLANDVCGILGYTNPRRTIDLHCKERGVTKWYTPTESGKQEMTYINESNLYRLIIKSRKPEAELFEEWVMEEVLPTIRKTGSYTNPTVDRCLNDWEAGQIQLAATRRKDRTGESYQAIYRKLHAYMGVDSFYQIKVTDFQTALNFLASIENVPVKPKEPQLPRNLHAALFHGSHCAEFLYKHYGAIKALNSRMAVGLYSHIESAILCSRDVAKEAGIKLPPRSAYDAYPWDGTYEERRYILSA